MECVSLKNISKVPVSVPDLRVRLEPGTVVYVSLECFEKSFDILTVMDLLSVSRCATSPDVPTFQIKNHVEPKNTFRKFRHLAPKHVFQHEPVTTPSIGAQKKKKDRR